MPVEVRGKSDPIVNAIVAALGSYQRERPNARITVYRHNPVSVWVRVVDPEFSRMNRVDRNDRVWQYLDRLDDEEQADVSRLVLLAPEEVEKSIGNMDFDDPIPSIFAET